MEDMYGFMKCLALIVGTTCGLSALEVLHPNTRSVHVRINFPVFLGVTQQEAQRMMREDPLSLNVWRGVYTTYLATEALVRPIATLWLCGAFDLLSPQRVVVRKKSVAC